MIAPNSHVRQKEGAQGEGKEEVEEREDRQEVRNQVRTLPQVQLGQGCGMRGAGENMDGGVEFPSTRKAEGTGGSSYLFMIEMEGTSKG